MSGRSSWTDRSDRLKKSFAKKSRVVGPVQRHVEAEIFSAVDARRRDAIHASDLSLPFWCARHDWYTITGHPLEGKDVTFWNQQIFDRGDEIHDRWQRRLWRMGVLVGDFSCLVCDHQWHDTSPKECPVCATEDRRTNIGLLRYDEVGLASDEHLLVGHADAELTTGELVEFKGIGTGTIRHENPELLAEYTVEVIGRKIVDINRLWANIRRPFPSHLRQGLLYLYMRGAEWMIFVYESKIHQQTKEFVIRYDPAVVGPLLEQAKDLKYAVKKNRLPVRPEWGKRTNSVCKGCGHFRRCYEENQSDDKKAVEEPELRTGKARTRAAALERRRRDRAVAGTAGGGDAGTSGGTGRRPRRGAVEADDVDDAMDGLLGRRGRSGRTS